MAVRSREELLNSINSLIGEENNDAVIGIIEDVTDTLDDYDARVGTAKEWEDKYNENDAMWREKYRSRFFDKSSEKEPETDVTESIIDSANEVNTEISFDELFTTGE